MRNGIAIGLIVLSLALVIAALYLHRQQQTLTTT